MSSTDLCYLLDTDTCIYSINRRPASVRERFEQLVPGSIAMSVVTYHELFFGALNSQRVEQNLQALKLFTEQVPVLSWSIEAAVKAAQIRHSLKKSGQLIGSWDMQIAGHAIALGITLVSNNLREFSRIGNLSVESWTDSTD